MPGLTGDIHDSIGKGWTWRVNMDRNKGTMKQKSRSEGKQVDLDV